MINVLITILVVYLLYKLVFDFIVPVARTTSHFKSQVNQMYKMQEEQMREQQQTQNGSFSNKAKASSVKSTTTTDGEYIDFEEVK
jgi:sortase (surface protein transpeptidase)